jgi:hypothetical protein
MGDPEWHRRPGLTSIGMMSPHDLPDGIWTGSTQECMINKLSFTVAGALETGLEMTILYWRDLRL